MHLEVTVRPDPIRISRNNGRPLPKLFNLDVEIIRRTIKNETFTCRCFDDVKKWAGDNMDFVWSKGDGAHFYCLYIREPDTKDVHFEMPRGMMNFDDRLWKAIDMYATWYEGIP
jgi:hypothetical protein